MKLRNKKTGAIDNWCIDKDVIRTCSGSIVYNSLAKLNEEWEDYEEPKDYWYLNCDGTVIRAVYKSDDLERSLIAIGNYFENPEEAEKAVEKLEAWKRLKDAGFWFKSDSIKNGHKYEYILRLQCKEDKRFKTFKENEDLFNDLKLLFRGEE